MEGPSDTGPVFHLALGCNGMMLACSATIWLARAITWAW